MSLLIVDRVEDAQVLLVVAREKDRCADEDRPAPESGKKGALEPELLDEHRVAGRFDRGNLLLEREPDDVPASGIEMDLPDLAVEIARGDLKDLSLPLVHVQFDCVSVRAGKRGVYVQNPLHEVIPDRQVRQARDGIAEGAISDGGPLSRA